MNTINCPVDVGPLPVNCRGLGPHSKLILERGNLNPNLIMVKHPQNGVLGYLSDHMSDFIFAYRGIDLSEIEVTPSEIRQKKDGSIFMRINIIMPNGV